MWEGPLPSRSLTSAMAEPALGRRRPSGSPDAVLRAYWRRRWEAGWGGPQQARSRCAGAEGRAVGQPVYPTPADSRVDARPQVREVVQR